MKRAKFSGLLGFGLVMALLMGCFNPVGVTSPDNDAIDNAPFEVDIAIGRSRSVVGSSKANIKAGLYNYMQLVVVDAGGNIVAYDEARKAASDSPAATLQIDTIPYGATYKFLLLFGDWPRNVGPESPVGNNVIHVYDDTAGVKPTLLASGYKEYKVEGDGTITIQMWPLVIDTQIQQGVNIYNPTTGVPTEVFQGVGPGQVKWQIGKNEDGSGNGLEALIAAEGGSGSLAASLVYYIDSVQQASSGSTTHTYDNLLPVKDTLPAIGTEYTASFNVEYVPFNKTTSANWAGFTSDYFDFAEAPKWIIRNGLNDDKQNTATDFEKVGKPAGGYNYKDYNGNGGIPLKVKETLGFIDDNNDGIPDGVDDTIPSGGGDGSPEDTGTSDLSKYLLYAGKFFGKSGDTANISFTTRGYNGDAQVYSLVTAKDAYSKTNWPPYDQFTPYGDYAAGTHGLISAPKTITNSLIGAGDADIWLVFIKDGKVSNRIRINTRSGSIGVIPVWPAPVDFAPNKLIIIPQTGGLTSAAYNQVSYVEYYTDKPVWELSNDGIYWVQIGIGDTFDRSIAHYRVTYPLHTRSGYGFDDVTYYGLNGTIGNGINYTVYYLDYTQMDVVYTLVKQP
jgi:hypothetical protein